VGSIIKHTKATTEVKHSLVCYREIKMSEVVRIMEYIITKTGKAGQRSLEIGFGNYCG